MGKRTLLFGDDSKDELGRKGAMGLERERRIRNVESMGSVFFFFVFLLGVILFALQPES